MAQQTAVNWLVNRWKKLQAKGEKMTWQQIIDITELAKEMEKEQIIETWHNGYNNQSPMIDEENCGQQYYNETYNQ